MHSSLAKAAYLNLSTFRRDGRDVKTPVWFAEDGGALVVFSEGDAGKVKRVRATGRVEVAACDVRGAVRGPWLPGKGRVVSDADREARAYAALRKKYGWQMRITDFVSTLTGRIGNRAVLELEIEESAE